MHELLDAGNPVQWVDILILVGLLVELAIAVAGFAYLAVFHR
tara:strand:+ start:36 stop:161 length:126 start_codon:yes stop_codon:yes gene_type:complete